jgi:hypothetical protein
MVVFWKEPMDPARSALRIDTLRASLLTTVDLLRRCRAGEIAGTDIDDYVALDWLEWNGGSLRLTTTGSNVCRQLSTRPG